MQAPYFYTIHLEDDPAPSSSTLAVLRTSSSPSPLANRHLTPAGFLHPPTLGLYAYLVDRGGRGQSLRFRAGLRLVQGWHRLATRAPLRGLYGSIAEAENVGVQTAKTSGKAGEGACKMRGRIPTDRSLAYF